MPWPETGATHYHSQLELKVIQITSWLSATIGILVPLDLLNGLALGCYQPFPFMLDHALIVFCN